jgi:hypothetical protein
MVWVVPALIQVRKIEIVIGAKGSTVIPSGNEDCGSSFGREDRSHS